MRSPTRAAPNDGGTRHRGTVPGQARTQNAHPNTGPRWCRTLSRSTALIARGRIARGRSAASREHRPGARNCRGCSGNPAGLTWARRPEILRSGVMGGWPINRREQEQHVPAVSTGRVSQFARPGRRQFPPVRARTRSPDVLELTDAADRAMAVPGQPLDNRLQATKRRAIAS